MNSREPLTPEQLANAAADFSPLARENLQLAATKSAESGTIFDGLIFARLAPNLSVVRDRATVTINLAQFNTDLTNKSDDRRYLPELHQIARVGLAGIYPTISPLLKDRLPSITGESAFVLDLNYQLDSAKKLAERELEELLQPEQGQIVLGNRVYTLNDRGFFQKSIHLEGTDKFVKSPRLRGSRTNNLGTYSQEGSPIEIGEIELIGLALTSMRDALMRV